MVVPDRTLLLLTFFAVFLTTLTGTMSKLVGGTGVPQNITSEIQSKLDSLKPEIEKFAGKEFAEFKGIQYSSQVVAGINYFVKVQVNENDYIHVRIYQNLQNEVSVHGVQLDKSADDKVEYF